MKRKIFIGSTPDLPDMSIVGVAGFSEGGSLELPRWASEFKSLKIVFYTDPVINKMYELANQVYWEKFDEY